VNGAQAAEASQVDPRPASEIPPGARRMFGLKDLFTSVNALSGVVSIYFCIKGRPVAASFAVLAGYFADTLDGPVARATRASNRFGAEFDTAADYVAHALAPAFVIYTLYAQAAGRLGVSPGVADAIGLGLACVLVLAATIRQARGTVRPVAVDFAWIGLPRVVASFILLGFANSVFWSRVAGGLWAGIPLVLAVAVAELTNWPFMNHHGRAQWWWAKLGVLAFLTTTPAAVIFAPRYAWDVLFLWTAGYAGLSWTAMSPDERRQVRAAVAAAKAKLVSEEIARYKARAQGTKR